MNQEKFLSQINSNFSKGNWTVGIYQNNISQIPTIEVDGEVIAKVGATKPHFEEAEANAKLIAASPIMIETLLELRKIMFNTCFDELPQGNEMRYKIQQAINSAL